MVIKKERKRKVEREGERERNHQEEEEKKREREREQDFPSFHIPHEIERLIKQERKKWFFMFFVR